MLSDPAVPVGVIESAVEWTDIGARLEEAKVGAHQMERGFLIFLCSSPSFSSFAFCLCRATKQEHTVLSATNALPENKKKKTHYLPLLSNGEMCKRSHPLSQYENRPISVSLTLFSPFMSHQRQDMRTLISSPKFSYQC